MFGQTTSFLGVFALTASIFPPASLAQIRGSELGAIAQTIDGTTISVEYSRPQARGRDPVFGGIVHWGELWTPGANWATTVEVSKDVRLNGHDLPKGKYSLWMAVQPGQWEVTLDPKPRRHHIRPPSRGTDQIRFMVTPQEAPHMEVLTFSFPEVSTRGATLTMHWGNTRALLHFEIEPSAHRTVTGEEAAPYLGSYAVEFEPEAWAAPEGAPQVAVPADRSAEMEVFHEDGYLMLRWGPTPPWLQPEQMLVPRAKHVFVLGFLLDGQLMEEDGVLFVEFQIEDGQITGFDFRAFEDEIIARGHRTN